MNPSTTLLIGVSVVLTMAAIAMALTMMRAYRKQAFSLHRQQEMVAKLRHGQQHSTRSDQSLRKVVRRHLKQSLQMKAELDQLQRQLRSLDVQVAQRSDLGQAINQARSGGSLEPLLNRARLNPAEAHLLKMVHLKNTPN